MWLFKFQISAEKSRKVSDKREKYLQDIWQKACILNTHRVANQQKKSAAVQ